MDSRLYPQGKKGIKAKYNKTTGVLDFYDNSGNIIYSLDPSNRRLDIPTGSNLRIGGNTFTGAELGALDGVTLGTKAASKAVTLDANRECDSLGDIRVADKIITTAQVKALNGTPITVLAAVGATSYCQFLGAYVLMDYATTQYTAGAGKDLVFQNLSAGDVLSHSVDDTMFVGAADILLLALPVGEDASTIKDLVANGGVEVTILVGEWITGDSPLKIRLFYRLIRAASLEAIA